MRTLEPPFQASVTRSLAALALLLGAPALAAAAPEPAATPALERREGLGVHGRVLGEVEPLAAARVYAYQLADFSLYEVTTNEQGRFRFSELPAGLYKIIAHKAGFVPAVVMLTRAREDARQFLELQLATEGTGDVRAGEDFWAVRDRIPADVLREITRPEQVAGLRLADSPFARDAGVSTASFATEMEAMTGVEQLATRGEALLAGGQVGVEGRMGDVRVDLSGDYWRLGPAGAYPEAEAEGQMRQIALRLEGGASTVAVSTRSQQLVGTDDEPVDFETHRLAWTQELGDRSRAHLAAGYSSQTNYYSQSAIAPLEIPRDSSTWEVEGTYTLEMTERASFQGGARYRDRKVGVATAEAFGRDDPTLHDERLDLFGRAGMRVKPAVLVEYGLYTTLRDGSLSLIPQGGLVLQLGDDWQASTLVSHKLTTDEQPGPRDFIPAFYHESSACTQGEESCYKVLLTRRNGEESDLTLGAVHRKVGETLRLFFNDDFFNHLESLYLVEGDELPELQFGFTRRVAPQLLARIESNVGSGGGGIFYATDRSHYENSVRYLVTSLDTHYQGTATGLFISFHHLQQELEPLDGQEPLQGLRATGRVPKLDLQRLQLMLTQDLNILLDLAADWAVKLNMEVSRGSVLFGSDTADDDELRRRILGGFAVRF